MRHAVALLIVIVVLATACAVNPATGRRQISLIGESSEREMGAEYDKLIVAQMGLYPDDALQAYLQRLGARLAAASERPDLDWTFRVVDDPVVNAFALPGGYIYMTRGILAHLNSEAEVASVLGHEIGHVTARHSVNQMSKAQLAQIGLGVGSILAPQRAQQFGGLAQTATGVLFLKFGRDDERQADELGLRYLLRDGYDPRPMIQVFRTLEAVSAAAGGSRSPAWLSTHPDPGNRAETIEADIRARNEDWTGRPVRREEYLAQIDGIVFGDDPRQGFFEGAVFYHPEMQFVLTFPDGWTTRNAPSSVSAMNGDKNTAVQLSLAQQPTAAAARDKFLAEEGIDGNGAWGGSIPGFTSVGERFTATTQSGTLKGLAVFVQDGERVFTLLGYGTGEGWSANAAAARRSIESFGRLTDRAKLDVKPQRLASVDLSTRATLRTFAQRENSAVPLSTLALINRVEEDAVLDPGRYKVVRAP